ncbi:hypothetical protein BC832DRAFT_309563 [Gaertneriomyces semiglobifer]|nr:hypothetical protein BC832DRAFT_309563 [Gaertneriomyces semiglobifer]
MTLSLQSMTKSRTSYAYGMQFPFLLLLTSSSHASLTGASTRNVPVDANAGLYDGPLSCTYAGYAIYLIQFVPMYHANHLSYAKKDRRNEREK